MAWYQTGTLNRFQRQNVRIGRLFAPLDTIGSVGASTVTAAEYGDGVNHSTLLTLSSFGAGTSGDNAALALGALVYTFPAGIIQVESASFIALATTAAISVTSDTPEIGLGTTVASGANATLGAVAATAENIFEGTAIDDVNGTAFTRSDYCNGSSSIPLIIAAASAHTVYLNYAVTWSDISAAGAVTASGTILINWRKLS